jgi:hypothetical protein
MLQKHKQPSFEAGLMIILLVISVISLGFLSEGRANEMGLRWIEKN